VILHLVTDSRSLAPDAASADRLRCLLEQLSYAAAAGIDVIQIRERHLEGRDLAALVADAVRIARPRGTRVVVNDRLDVALAAGADGVHLREDSITAADVRRLAPPGFLVGRSVHGRPSADDVEGVDYLIAGTVWPSASKPTGQPLLGVDGLRGVIRSVTIPVLAIGGITADRVGTVGSTGAAGVAAIGLFCSDTPDPSACRAVALADRVAKLRRMFDTPRSAS
jgi:thiamine-phosphate pyrophosphorylase